MIPIKIHMGIFLSLFIVSCASAPAVAPDIAPLGEFFEQCRTDMEKAKKVIADRDLVKNLTHLQYMAGGGDRYYLLEKEAVTAMIRSVTAGAYADFILINRQGAVVYSMSDHAVFAKNVLTGLKNSALRECYENRNAGLYIGKASVLPGEDRYTIAISSKVGGMDTMPGIFALIVDISKIQELIGDKASIIDSTGNYLVAKDLSKINAHFIDFNKIDLSRERSWYRFLRLDGTLWIIISE
jgi:hypothetical protein